MIQIYINGCELAIYRDTTLNIEYNNALFSKDAMEGDIVYSFDIPIRGNERALNFEHLPYSVSHRKYDCTISVGGINIITGKLVVQKVTDKKYSVAVLVNPYPEGFSGRKITENDSEDIEISESSNVHQSRWLQFLQSSITDDRIKFGPFINENGYGSENEDFGFWNGENVGKIVNRLVVDSDGAVVESSDNPFVRVFQKENVLDQVPERNQFCFMPQVRLGTILSNIIANAGYHYENHVDSNQDLRTIHIQSPTALDATIAQYNEQIDHVYLYTFRDMDETPYEQYYPVPTEPNNNVEGMMGQFFGVKFPSSGWYKAEATEHTDFYNDGGDITFRVAKWASPSDYCYSGAVGHHNGGDGLSLNYSCMFYVPANFVGVSLKVGFYINDTYLRPYTGGSQLRITSYVLDNLAYGNMFRKSFRLAEVFPNVTNSEFLSAATKTLGLAYYADNRSGIIEILPFREIRNAKSLDLSEYLLSNETDIEYAQDATYIWKLSPMEEPDDIDGSTIEPVGRVDDLPFPYDHMGKFCFVREANAYYKCEKLEDEDTVWRMEWVNAHTNLQKTVIGGIGENNETKSGAEIPSQDYDSSYQNPLPYIPMDIHGDVYNTDKEADKSVVMLVYRGLANRDSAGTQRYCDMRPVIPGDFSLNSESLTHLYVEDWQKLVHLSRTTRYKFRIPISTMLAVAQLLQPQRVSPSNQVRWLMVDNVRTMPKKISFQIDNNDALVLCEIEAAKPD